VRLSSPPAGPPSADAPTAGAGAASIARWLLGGTAQVETGPQAGAVAGLIDASGRAVYAYPEIAGYFLQWLAWRAREHGVSPELGARARATQRWLAHWLASGDPPPTRVPLVESPDDWRNAAVFCFDLAMVLRGLGSAARGGLLEPDPGVVAGVTHHLGRVIGPDGLFDACVPNRPSTALPDRWSTRRGPFLAKASAGIVAAAEVLPGVPAAVRAAAAATHAAALSWAVETPHEEVHPMLYALEGALSLPRHPRFAAVLPALAAQFDALLAATGALGRVPEALGPGRATSGPERVDIVAQALRVGHLLGLHRPERPPDRVGLQRICDLLVARIEPDGAVPFDATQRPIQRNVWAAMFAEQALGFLGRDTTRPSLRDDPLIV